MKIVLVFSTLFLSACNGVVKEPVQGSSSDRHQVTRLPNKASTSQALYNLYFNGAVFESNSRRLVSGQRVFNKSMGEYGVVKGELIVVSSKHPRAVLDDKMEIRKIAEDTWKVQVSSSQNVYQLYRELLNQALKVEISVDYSSMGRTNIVM
ncbi:hypothetical protein D5R81_12910 [Parashewanella spongiae]|uniref:Uncharacterized protein n=1 Tax=Parashewanella spongiae TaxID=342950 RepID=A0A3A6TLC7_9GAMM|nr:hypothetical protein [Parashewanella spongiae]MCL1078861.1 hypothetical protein [Parashewanella spongiae]RJY11837.1 hypothetical protein D5R81_12910 [Parashewanella spongiae]